MIPLPPDWQELERLVARFARLYLNDDLAKRYLREGHTQYGVDVLAHDRRPGKHGARWAFQCKETKKFQPADLRAELTKLESSPVDVSHFVIVTTATVSAAVHNAAEKASTAALGVAVWDWTEFSERAKEAGVGPWLSAEVRSIARRRYAQRLIDDFERACVLYPRTDETNPRLAEVWVDVAPELLTSPQAGRAAVRPLEGWLADESLAEVVLVGDMGTGKSVSLLRAAERIGRRILEGDGERALPLRVLARDLTGRRAPEAMEAALPAEAQSLWQDPLTDWALWVDGLDEVRDPRERSTLLDELRGLKVQPRVLGVAVATRPGALDGVLPGATRLRLGAWSPTQAQALTQRLSPATRPEHVAASRTPLYATLEGVYGDPRHPSRGLEALLRAAYTDWAEERGHSPEAWRELRQGLEELALGATLSAEDLQTLAVRLFSLTEVQRALSEAEHLQVLTRDAANRLVFADAHVQTTLAAAALARCDDDALRALAERAALGDVLRLTLDRVLEEAPERVERLLPALATLEHHPVEGVLSWLDAAIDLLARGRQEAEAALLTWAVDLACSLVLQEGWPWVRAAARERLARLSGSPEPVWAALWERVQAHVDRPHDRARWFAAQEFSALPADAWRTLLTETPAVRAVAANKLANDLAAPQTVEALLWTLLDDGGGDLMRLPPAVASGSSLRKVTGEARARVVEVAKSLLKNGGQFGAGGAALALLPGEAEIADILSALRKLSYWRRTEAVFQAVDALRAEAGAAAWLAKHWPDAPTAPPEPWPEPPIQTALPERPPPSEDARADLIRGLVPGLLRGPDLARRLWRSGHLLTELCRAGYQQPERLTELLRAERLHFLQPEAQAALGRAALAHEAVATALLDAWPPRGVEGQYPGLALEPLILRDPSSPATAIYIAWLPHFPFAEPLAGALTSPSREVLEVSAVRDAALGWARALWEYATEGRPDAAGEVKRLHELSMGMGLGAIAPTWTTLQEVQTGLLDRARAGEGQWLGAALAAWSLDRGAPDELLDLAARRVRAQWSTLNERSRYEIPSLLHELRRRNAASRVAAVSREILRARWPAGMVQAALVLAELDGDLPSQSRALAELWPHLAWSPPRHDAERLLGAASAAWAAKLPVILDEHGVWGATDVFGVLESLVRVPLSEAAQRDIERVLRWFQARPLLWVRQREGLHSVRAADRAAQIQRALRS